MFQQRQSTVFTQGIDDTYDAYEKDIAVVSFFFKRDTMFEFKRYDKHNAPQNILSSKLSTKNYFLN